PLHRGCRRNRNGRAADRHATAADRRLPRPLDLAGARRGGDRSVSTDHYTGRVAVSTGASSGIGEATARAMAADGHRVALLARRADRIDECWWHYVRISRTT